MWTSLDYPSYDLGNVDALLSNQPSAIISDSRNAYDGLKRIESSGLHLEEKRTAIELMGMKERVRGAAIDPHWVDSDQELADGFTKAFSSEQLVKALTMGRRSIHFDPESMSAKRKRQMLGTFACEAVEQGLNQQRVFERCWCTDAH